MITLWTRVLSRSLKISLGTFCCKLRCATDMAPSRCLLTLCIPEPGDTNMVSNIAAIMIDISVVSLTAVWVLDRAVLMSRIAATYVLVDCSARSGRFTVLA